MITKFKIYENINQPQIGDYVICKDDYYDKLNEYLSKNIGEIIGKNKITNIYFVKFDEMPQIINKFYFNSDNERGFIQKDIIYWNKDKSELEVTLNSKKYNI